MAGWFGVGEGWGKVKGGSGGGRGRVVVGVEERGEAVGAE